jgi:hypothetical protein
MRGTYEEVRSGVVGEVELYRVLQVYCKSATRALQGRYKRVTRILQVPYRGVKNMSQGFYKFTRMSQACHQRAESRKQRAESREQRAESREQRAESCTVTELHTRIHHLTIGQRDSIVRHEHLHGEKGGVVGAVEVVGLEFGVELIRIRSQGT